MNNKKLICFDFETNSVDPYSCDVFQLAAVAIDPIKLEIVPNSLFNSWIKPDNMERESYYDEYKSTIDWHCKKMGLSKEDFLDKVKNSLPEKIVWEQFIQYLSNYHDRQNNQNYFSSPIPAGFNIIAFDMPIITRLCKKYKNIQKDGSQGIFYIRDIKDILHISTLWLEPIGDLKSFSMDSIRDYVGITQEGGHQAKKDVIDSAEILIRFLKLHQKLAKNLNFKNSFAQFITI